MYKNKTGFHLVSCEANAIDTLRVHNKVISESDSIIYVTEMTWTGPLARLCLSSACSG